MFTTTHRHICSLGSPNLMYVAPSFSKSFLRITCAQGAETQASRDDGIRNSTPSTMSEVRPVVRDCEHPGHERYLGRLLCTLLKICDILCGDGDGRLKGLECALNTSLPISCDGFGKLRDNFLQSCSPGIGFPVPVCIIW